MGALTSIPKSYTFGFVLTEQEFRRLIKTCTDQLLKKNETVSHKFTATLMDHSLVQSDDIEEILTLENGGSKSIVKLEIQCKATEEKINDVIVIQFQDGNLNQKGWESISFEVKAIDRDWAFLTASELEDRIKKLRFFSLPQWYSQSVVSTVAYGLAFIALVFLFNTYVEPSANKAELLNTAYKNGQFQNAIEAFIYWQELQSNKHSTYYYLMYLVLLFVVPFVFTNVIKWAATRIYKSYVFCWGDQITLHDKAMGRVKVFVVAIILGALASIIGTLVLKLVGI